MTLSRIFTTLLLFITTLAVAQNATVNGKVYDDLGNPLPMAGVFINGKLMGATTIDGTFTYQIPQGENVLIKVTYQSYFPVELRRNIGAAEVVNLTFRLKPKELGTVVVSAPKTDPGITPIDIKTVNAIVTPAGGIEGIIKTLAGVVSNNELSSQYSVRGGNYDENLTYVNDIEVYRPFLVRSGQQEGLSFINPDMVENINFSAGGFEARFGDKMSSVLDIRYRKPTKFAGSASASLLGFTGQIEGTIKQRFTYMIGARQRTTQYLLNSLDTKGNYRPSFTDVQGQFTYDFTEKLSLQILGNYAQNVYRVVPENRETSFGTLNQALKLRVFFEGQEQNRFDTYMGAASLNWQTSNNWLNKFIVSAFQSVEQENTDILGQYFLNELESDFGSDDFGQLSALLGVGSFLNHNRNVLRSTVANVEHKSYLNIDNHKITYGIKFQHEEFEDKLSEWRYVDSADFSVPSGMDDIILLQDVVKTKINLSSNRVMGYVQYSFNDTLNDNSPLKPKHIWWITAGVRANYWDVNKQTVVSPRFQFAFQPDWKNDTIVKERKNGKLDTIVKQKQWLFRVQGGYYYQPPFYRELRDLNGVLNTSLQAQKSIHAIIGFDHYFKAWKRDFKMVVEGYYKYLDNLIPYEIDNVRIRYYAQNLSYGYATGLDMRINGEFVKGVESWMSLSIMGTKENLRNDVYYENYNAEGKLIIPGFTADQTVVKSIKKEPGFIPRPMDQRVTFSVFFQDHLPKWPTFKMSLTLTFGSGFPFGPPDLNRYKDTLRMPFYRRVDIGFSKDIITEKTKFKNPNGFFSHFKNVFIRLEIFNLLGVNNTVSYLWVKDYSGRQYAIPNYLTNRLINLRLYAKF